MNPMIPAKYQFKVAGDGSLKEKKIVFTKEILFGYWAETSLRAIKCGWIFQIEALR